MKRRSAPKMTGTWLLPVLLVLIGSIGCDPATGVAGGQCIAASCPAIPVLLTVSIPDGGAATGVQATLSGVTTSCAPTVTGAECRIYGQAPELGPLEVTAAGFQTVEVNATVTTTPARGCGCPGLKLEPSSVTLSLAPDSGVDATTEGGTDEPATDGGGTGADPNTIEAACDARTEQTCEGDKQCSAFYGSSTESYCANGLSRMIYAACLPAQYRCDAVITWATDPKTGRTLVFNCWPFLPGWSALPSDQCPSPDAGGDAGDH
jgi:hypothetical protein